MIVAGSRVLFARMPTWVDTLPEESKRVFHLCFGREYVVLEVDSNGFVVLDVSRDIDKLFGGFQNDIRLERDFLEEITL